MPNINEWLASGRNPRVNAANPAWVYHGCQCDPTLELAASPADRAAWLQVCPGCQAQMEAASGLPFVPGVGFAAPGALNVPMTAKPITYTPPPIVQPGPQMAQPDPAKTALSQPDERASGIRTDTDVLATAGRTNMALGVGDYVPWGPGRPQGLSLMPTVRATPINGNGSVGAVTGYDVGGAVTGGLEGYQTGGWQGALTGALLGLLGGGETTTAPGTAGRGAGFTGSSSCPEGFEWVNGQCQAVGISGTLQRWIPGGATGVYEGGSAVMGGFGIPALQPMVQSTPRLICPSGMVLGKDNLCYMKGALTNRMRKWPKGRRPLLTGGEMKTLAKAKTLTRKVQKAWRAAGSPGQRKCATKTTRRK